MAEAADIGANFSNYAGNAGNVGGNFGPITIDTKPLQQLAEYTFLYKRDQWQQKKKEADAKVKELADLSDIALNNLRGKDKEQLKGDFTKLIQSASDYARKIPKNENERIQNELEWQTTKGAFYNNYNSGKSRAISYEAQKVAINSAQTNAKTKEEQLRILDEAFDKTGIDTPISAIPNFEIKKFDIPKPIASTFSSLSIGKNDNYKISGSYYDPSKNGAIAGAELFNIKKALPKKGTPEYDNLSEAERNQVNIQSTMDNPASGWIDAIPALNDALQKKEYLNEDGTFNYVKFENDNASNTVLMKPFNAFKNLDVYSRQKFQEASVNMFSDNGLEVQLPSTVIPNNFKAGFVDFTKGVSAEQLLNAGMFAQYEGDKFTKDVTHTGEANDLLKSQLDREAANYRARLNEEGANTRAKYPYLYAKKGTDKQDEEDILNVDSVLSEVSSIINSGKGTGTNKTATDVFFGGKDSPYEISDPTILKEFTTITKDGKTTIPPSSLKYDKKKDELILTFEKFDDKGKALAPEIQRLNAQTYLTMKVKQKFPNKDIGTINSLISKIFKKEGNLLKIAEMYGKAEETPTPENNTPEDDSKLSDGQYFLKYKKLRKKK